MPTVINPTLTAAGQAAAFNADNDGIEISITHISFGTGHYDPTGFEESLDAEIAKVPVSGGSRVSPTQIRISAAWSADSGTYGIGEVGFWAGSILFAVWSKFDGQVVGYKTPGVDFVLFQDMVLNQVPASSVNVLVDEDESATMAALAAHEGAGNAHPQYVRHDSFPDAQINLWAENVGGTANEIALTLKAGVSIADYAAGQSFTFQAGASNTDEVTVAIDAHAPVPVLKNGTQALAQGDIKNGAVYVLIHDGANFHLTGGVGSGGESGLTEYVYTATDGQVTFAAAYVTETIFVFLNGRYVPRSEYVAVDGITVSLNDPCVAGDEVAIIRVKGGAGGGGGGGGFDASIASGSLTAQPFGCYFVDVSSGPVTITLPATPSVGTGPVKIIHYKGDITANKIIVARNGEKIMALAEDMDITTPFAAVTLRFSDADQGWRLDGI